MKKKIYLLILFSTLYSFGQNSNQKKIDSLLLAEKKCKIDTLRCVIFNQISNYYLYSNIDQGILFANKGLTIAKNRNWQYGIGQSNLNIASHLTCKGNFDEATKKLKIAETIFISLSDSYNLASVYNQFGILKANQGKFPEALDYFFKSLKNFEETKKKDRNTNIANIYQNIANIYSATESYDKAIENYNKAIGFFEKIKSQKTAVAMNMASKGLVLQKQKKYTNALQLLKTAEKILIAENAKAEIGFVSSWLGSIYLSLNNYDLSIEYSQKSIETISQIGDQVLMASTIQNIGYAYLKKGIKINNESDINKGFTYISKSLKLNKSNGNLELLLNDYKYLSEYYSYKKEFEKSLDAYKAFSKCSDSIFNTKNKQSLQNLQDQRTIELNHKQIQLNKITLENKEKQKWYLILGIFLLATIGILLFYQSNNRKKTNKKLQSLNSELDQANKTKVRFFSILNHDLRSPVTNLIHFLHLQKENPELIDEESKKRMESKIITGAENLLTSMEDILLWSKGQMENFKPQPKNISINSIFNDTKIHFSSEEKVKLLFENPQNIELTTDENYLKTIIRNLTGNAIKAISVEGQITWKAWQENKQIFLSISDNGKGAEKDQFKALYNEDEIVGIKNGLGLHLIRDLAKAIHCEIKVESKGNFGTTFTLTFIK